jgi:hypothetical protein
MCCIKSCRSKRNTEANQKPRGSPQRPPEDSNLLTYGGDLALIKESFLFCNVTYRSMATLAGPVSFKNARKKFRLNEVRKKKQGKNLAWRAQRSGVDFGTYVG